MYGVAIGDPNKSLGVFLPGKHVSAGQAFGWEVILTFILVQPTLSYQAGGGAVSDLAQTVKINPGGHCVLLGVIVKICCAGVYSVCSGYWQALIWQCWTPGHWSFCLCQRHCW